MADPLLIEKIDNLAADVAVLSRVLIGNGDTGKSLIVQFHELKEGVTGEQGCQARAAEDRKRRRNFWPWAISTVVAIFAIIIAATK